MRTELIADARLTDEIVGLGRRVASQMGLRLSDGMEDIAVQLHGRVAEGNGAMDSMSGHGKDELIAQTHLWSPDPIPCSSVALEVIEFLHEIVTRFLGRHCQ